jgi:hypothetical protein
MVGYFAQLVLMCLLDIEDKTVYPVPKADIKGINKDNPQFLEKRFQHHVEFLQE